MKIVVQQNRRGEWFHHLLANNGKILQHSEAYSSKTKCMQTVKSICKVTGLSFIEKGK